MRLRPQDPVFQLQAHALGLVAEHDAGPRQRAAQHQPVGDHHPVALAGDHALVIGELALDQLGGQADVTQHQPDMVGADPDRRLDLVVAQQAQQFQHTLARHDHLAGFRHVDFGRQFLERQPVAVGGDQP